MEKRVDITVPHSLTQEAAFQRVLACLQAQKDKPSIAEVHVEDVHVVPGDYTLVVKIIVSVTVLWVTRNEKQTLTFLAYPDVVRVTSDEADNVLEAGIMLAESRQLEAMLREALK